ncbi:MAG TPA: FtsQ-type POTRA domain-containing protein, partial [Kofleriaceae bacterium]
RPAAIADACGRALRRSLSTAAAMAALLALGGALWGGYRWLTHSPRFAITQIAIRGAHHIDPAVLRAQLPIHEGDSVFVGLGGAARTVRANPWIASAEVHRVLPHTIVIEVREHVAAAIAVLGDLYLVDDTGRPFKHAEIEAGDGDGLPLITGIERTAFTTDPEAAAATIQGAIGAASRWRAVDRRSRIAGGGDPDGSAGGAGGLPRGIDRPAIGEVHVGPHGAVTLHTHHPAIAIQLGDLGPELADRISAFDTAWAGLSDAERGRARAIHMDTRPDHVTVAFAKDERP